MSLTQRIAVITDTDGLDMSPGTSLLEAAGFTVRQLETHDPAEIVEAAHDADVLLAGYAPITADMIDACPKLRIIALMSMGYNSVDVVHATKHGIWVSNVLGAATHEVAEHALALALGVLRGLRPYQRSTDAGEWLIGAAPMPKSASLLRCSVLGYGRIGRAFVRLARTVFSEVRVYDPFVQELDETDAAAGVTLVDLDSAIAAADVLSLHLPVTDESRGMLSAERIAAMPADAVIVNVSRGELIDEAALEAALDSGHLYGAGLDVLAAEPPASDHPLRGRADVILTPHAGFMSDRTLREYPRLQAENVLTLDATGRPLTPVNDLGA